MIFYVLLIIYAIVCLLGVKPKTSRDKLRIIIIMLLPLFILVAFRGIKIGPDTGVYYRIFNSIKNANISLVDAVNSSRMEPGYIFVNYLLGKIGCTYFAMQIILTAFIYISLARFIYKYCSDPCLSCFLFYASHSASGTMNTVRMWVAIAILLYTVEFIKNRKIVPFICFLVLACLFHYSSVVFLVAYVMYGKKLTGIKTTGIIAFSLVVWRFSIPFFTYITQKIGLYGNYVTTERFGAGGNIAVVLSLLINIVYFIIMTISFRYNDEDDLYGAKETSIPYSFYYIIMVLTLAISIIGLSNNIMGRVSHYFSVFLIAGIPEAIIRYRNQHNRVVVKTALIVSLVAEFIVILVYRPEWYMITPYNFFFQ